MTEEERSLVQKARDRIAKALLREAHMNTDDLEDVLEANELLQKALAEKPDGQT
jgi:hypothetical protein